MKNITLTHTKLLALLAILPFALIGCGGSDTNWGIDQGIATEVSHGPLDASTGKYRCDLSDASLIEQGATVTPQTEDTEIRVWHFQNSEEYLCTLQGQAMITLAKGGK